MSSKSGYRFLLLGSIYTLYGLIINLFDQDSRVHSSLFGQIALLSIHGAVISIIIIGIVYLGIKGRVPLPVWGFTLNRGFLYSLGLVLLVTPFLGIGLRFANFSHFWEPLQILSTSMEEIAFRAAIINGILIILKERKGRALIAIGVSTIMFMIPHLPTHSFHHVMNSVLMAGIVAGLVYCWTRSLLFLMYTHVMLNMGASLGMTAGLMVFIIYFALALIGRAVEKRKIAEPVGAQLYDNA